MSDQAVTSGQQAQSGCPYPVEEFNNYLRGPVLSHVEAIDELTS